MRKAFLVLVAVILVSGLPILGDEPQSNGNARCEIAGTWFGGSDPTTPYLMTVIPNRAGRYTAVFQLAAPVHALGYANLSTWSGELVQIGPNRYEAWAIIFATLDPDVAAEAGVDPSIPELDYVHSYIEFTDDCNTVSNVIDALNWYTNFDFTKGTVPFVTEPDGMALPEGVTIDEVYYRMPTAGHGPEEFAATHLRQTVTNGGNDPRRRFRR